MGGQSSTPTTQTTTQELSPEQRQLLQLAMPGVQKYAASTPQRYQGSMVAPFDPAQQQGQNMALDAAGTQAGLAQSGANTSNYWMSGNVWDPANNPALRTTIDAAVRPISEQLTEKTLPAIRSEAVGTGNLGSSRQGIAEGMASREASRAIGDTASKIATQTYDTNVSAQLKAMGLLPTTQQAQVQPAVTTSGVGDVRQALAQALLSQDVSNFNYDQMAPFLQSQDIISLLNAIPGGSVTTNASGPQKNPLLSGLGGAAAGASLGSAVMPGIGTGVGALGGALLSLFGG